MLLMSLLYSLLKSEESVFPDTLMGFKRGICCDGLIVVGFGMFFVAVSLFYHSFLCFTSIYLIRLAKMMT